MSIKAIITGSTGMVGEGVLHECLHHPDVESVLVINRNPCGKTHPKLKEIIHADFGDFSSIENDLKGYNAAYLCMGTTSFGLNETDYTRITYGLTLALAEPLAKLNPDMTICYVSGAGSNSTENGRLMWTNVKGKTENALFRLPVKQAFMFRAGIIQPTAGLENTYLMYKLITPFLPLVRFVFPKMISTLAEIGQAMIQVTKHGYEHSVLEVKDIVAVAKSPN